VHRASGEEALSSLRDVELPKALSELRLAQERAAVEGHRDLGRMRHEVRGWKGCGMQYSRCRKEHGMIPTI
jgi:hypothetical protein